MTENVPQLVDKSELSPRLSPRKKSRQYVPSWEKPEYRAMFRYYESLGKDRSFRKVQKQFGKSLPFIATLSSTFHWVDRIRQNELLIKDPVIEETKEKIDGVRRRMVTVVDDIVDTLYEVAMLSQKVKLDQRIDDDGKLPEADLRQAKTLQAALGVYGIKLENPKGIKDLLGILKEVTRFHERSRAESVIPADKNAPIHIDNVDKLQQLVVKDD